MNEGATADGDGLSCLTVCAYSLADWAKQRKHMNRVPSPMPSFMDGSIRLVPFPMRVMGSWL